MNGVWRHTSIWFSHHKHPHCGTFSACLSVGNDCEHFPLCCQLHTTHTEEQADKQRVDFTFTPTKKRRHRCVEAPDELLAFLLVDLE